MKQMLCHVRDGLRPVDFTGEQIARVSTETDRPRWVELELYWATPSEKLPEGGYFTHIVGQSVVYHKHQSDCNTGVPATVEEIPEDSEPCEKCRPPALTMLDSDAWVDMESPRHTLYRTGGPREQAAVEMVQRMQRRPSAPAQRLLEMAAQEDPAIAHALEIAEAL